ncbi:hypothetical protein Tco_1344663 [Tanacetum coccineum]
MVLEIWCLGSGNGGVSVVIYGDSGGVKGCLGILGDQAGVSVVEFKAEFMYLMHQTESAAHIYICAPYLVFCEKCAAHFEKCGLLGAFSAFGPKTKVVENSLPVVWPQESRQSEFVCSSYGQNSGQKVYEVIIKKDSEMVKGKREQSRSLALKAKKESSDEESLTSDSEDEEYAMAVRDFKKFSKDEEGLCGDPNHLIGECPKPPRSKNQRDFVGGTWSDSGEDKEEKTKDETCLLAQVSNKICLGINLEPKEWIKDSGCSKHMTGNRKIFSTYKAYSRDSNKAKDNTNESGDNPHEPPEAPMDVSTRDNGKSIYIQDDIGLDEELDEDEVFLQENNMSSYISSTGGGFTMEDDDLDCYDGYEAQIYDLLEQKHNFCDQYDIRLKGRIRK